MRARNYRRGPGLHTGWQRFLVYCRQTFPYRIMEELPVIRQLRPNVSCEHCAECGRYRFSAGGRSSSSAQFRITLSWRGTEAGSR